MFRRISELDRTMRRAAWSVAFTAIAALIATGIVDAAPYTGPGWALRTALVLGMAGLWAAELSGRWLPTTLFAAGIAAITSWLNYDRLAAGRPGGAVFLVLLVAVIWIGLVGSLVESLVALGFGLAAATVYASVGDASSVVAAMLALALSMSTARAYVGQQRYLARLREAQVELAATAVADERRRIAADVHDVAAHSLAVTMLHLTGARMTAIREGASATLTEALAEAERVGRESMRELRAAVGLLSDPGVESRPLPRAADVPELVNACRAAGMRVQLEIEGEPESIAPGVGLSVYRVIQEALTNAAKHAPGTDAQVRLAIGDSIELSVVNETIDQAKPGDGRGSGLRGMSQRAAAVGGRVQAGPDGGAWRVHAVLPLRENGEQADG